MSVRNQPKMYEANRRPKGRHPLFCFISFIGICSPLTDIVIVHIVCIMKPTLKPIHSSALELSYDHVSASSYAHTWKPLGFRRRINYLVLRMQNPCRRRAIITLGANATTCRRQSITYKYPSISPYLRLFIVVEIGRAHV